MNSRFFALSALAFLLAACGFSPLYGQHSQAQSSSAATEASLDSVQITNIPDRSGVILRNALIDRFYTHGYPADARYVLTVDHLAETKRNLDITKSSEATRNQLDITATISLMDRQNPQMPALKRTLSSINSFNVLESEFATRVTEDNARLSGLNDLARQIELNLTLFFNRTRS